MTAQAPERVEPETINIEKYEFDVQCDIAALQQSGEQGFPTCPGEPARWVAWRERPCGHGPQYRLICEPCRQQHLNRVAQGTFFYCGTCGQETGPYVSFTPLKG